jgi:CRP-like cAMP-binding protein
MREWAAEIEGRTALLQGLLGGAGFAAETLAEVLVIEILGPAWLPLGLAGAAVLSLGLTAALARTPTGRRRLLGLAGVAMIIGVAIWGGMFIAPTVAALIFLLVSRPLRDAMAVAAGNLITARYDPLAAKRALPRLAAIGQTGAIVVGLTLPLFLRGFGATGAVIAWPILAGATLAAAWGLPIVLVDDTAGRQRAQPTVPVVRPSSPLRHSPLLRALAVAAMLAVATGAALGLAAAMLLSASVPNPARLASIYSLTGALCSLGILAVQVVGLPALLRRFGTARVAIVPPVLAMGVASLVVAGSGVAVGVASQVGRLTLRPALQTPVEEILLGLLPTRERGVGRAWLRGGAVPMAGLISSLGLVALAALGANSMLVGGIALMTGTGGLIAAFVLRRQHRQAALALARGQDILSQRLALPAFGGVDAAVKDEIVRRLESSARDEEQLLLVALLADLDPPAATAAVATLLPKVSPALAINLLSSLAERKCPAAALLPQVSWLLAAPEPALRQATLAALATARTLDTAIVRPFLDDPDPGVALAAVELLIGRSDTEVEQARTRLATLARNGPPPVRTAVASIAASAAPDLLVPLLADSSVAVRQAAASAAGTIAVPSAAVSAALIAATGDGASSVRATALGALTRLGSTAIPTWVGALDDADATVRAAATAALLKGSAGRVASLERSLPADHGWGRAAGLAILAHRKPLRWRTTLHAEESIGLAHVARLATARTALGPPHGPAGALLRRDVDDVIAEGMARWGEVLVITDGPVAARAIQHGLSSEAPLARAHAQEALEALRSPELARLAARLLAPPDSIVPVERPEHPAHTDERSLEILVIGAGDWRRTLLAAAAREEPGSPAERIATHALHGKDGTMLSLVERAILLRGVPPFADLPSEQLRLLARVAEEIEAVTQETLIVAGSSGDHLYVIIDGQIALEERRGAVGSVARIETLGPGAALGEEAVFDGGTHVLNATALTDCRLLTLERDNLMALLDEQPALARTLIAWLSARLRDTTGKLAERTRSRPRSVIDLLDKMGADR